jgi:hypothetical protein
MQTATTAEFSGEDDLIQKLLFCVVLLETENSTVPGGSLDPALFQVTLQKSGRRRFHDRSSSARRCLLLPASIPARHCVNACEFLAIRAWSAGFPFSQCVIK